MCRRQLEDSTRNLDETLSRKQDREDSLHLEAAQLRKQYAQLHNSSTTQGSRMAELVTLEQFGKRTVQESLVSATQCSAFTSNQQLAQTTTCISTESQLITRITK